MMRTMLVLTTTPRWPLLRARPASATPSARPILPAVKDDVRHVLEPTCCASCRTRRRWLAVFRPWRLRIRPSFTSNSLHGPRAHIACSPICGVRDHMLRRRCDRLAHYCVRGELATSLRSIVLTLGCADNDLAAIRRQCFYLAITPSARCYSLTLPHLGATASADQRGTQKISRSARIQAINSSVSAIHRLA